MKKQTAQKSVVGLVGLFSAIVLANQMGPAPVHVQAASISGSSLHVSSSVNAYIASHKLQPVGITKELHVFDTKDQEDVFAYRTGNKKPEGVVFYYTDNANNFSARNEADYEINGGWKNAFVHTFIDARTILNIHDIETGAWGSGAQGNKYFVQFELVTARNADEFARSVNNAAYYVAYLCHHFGWKPSLAVISLGTKNLGVNTLWTHYDVTKILGGTDHTDPIAYLNKHGYNTTQFLDLVKAHFNNKEEFPYYSVTNTQTKSNKATVTQTNRNDGLFKQGPYKTSEATMKPDAQGKALNGQVVTVIGSAQTSTATWDHIKLNNGTTYWIDARGLTTLYNTVSNHKQENYTVKLNQSKSNDGLFTGGAWFTNAASETMKTTAKQFNGQFATVIASETTKSQMSGAVANWVEVKLTSGATYWMDVKGVTKVNFYAISNQTTVNKSAVLKQSARNDGLFTDGPYMTSMATTKPNASGKAYNNQTVGVIAEAQTATGKWAKIRLTNGQTYWIDQRGLQYNSLYQVTDQQTVSQAATINQKGRSDGMFSDGPYKTSATTLKPNASAKSFDKQGVTVIATAKTATGNWAQIKLNSGKTYWIDARGLTIISYYKITSTTPQNQVVQVVQSGRHDGLFANGPYKTGASTMAANASAASFNGQYAQVTQSATTSTATWDKLTFSNGQSYWIDARGVKVASTYAITNQKQTTGLTAKIAQGSRSDGLFIGGPYRTNATSMKAAANAKSYNGQSVQITATANTATGSWAQIKLGNGSVYWIDQRGLTYAQGTLSGLNTNNLNAQQKNFLNTIVPVAVTVANANGLYPSVMVAQAILESNWGTSDLAVKANNYFGIKATKDWTGAIYNKDSGEHLNGTTSLVNSDFRSYASMQAGLSDYAAKLTVSATSPYYTGVLRSNAPDGQTAATGLTKWATDPNYVTKVVNAIKSYGLSALDQRQF